MTEENIDYRNAANKLLDAIKQKTKKGLVIIYIRKDTRILSEKQNKNMDFIKSYFRKVFGFEMTEIEISYAKRMNNLK